jgi:hypothetical protein
MTPEDGREGTVQYVFYYLEATNLILSLLSRLLSSKNQSTTTTTDFHFQP